MAESTQLDGGSIVQDSADLIEQTLRTCLRSRWDSKALSEASAALPAQDARWLDLADRAVRQRVAGLLFRPLRSLGDHIPPEALRRLETAYYLHATRNTLLCEELGHVLHRLEVAGVPTLALKGIALAELVYQDVSVRPMSDADLLIHRIDLPDTVQVLADMGYHPRQAEPRSGALTEFENELALAKAGPMPVQIEIHWHLIDSPFYQQVLSEEWIWSTARPAVVAGKPTRVLGLEAQILHLCAHMLLHHREPSQLWLHDLAELLVRSEQQIDWEDLLARAQDVHLVLPLQVALPQVVAGWHLPVPGPAVLDRLQHLAPSPQEQRIFGWLTSSHRPVAQRFYVDLTSLPAWHDRLRYALVHLFPDLGYMTTRYHIPHPVLVPFYYPYRWAVGVHSLYRTLRRRT
jgi:hypothetical protein